MISAKSSGSGNYLAVAYLVLLYSFVFYVYLSNASIGRYDYKIPSLFVLSIFHTARFDNNVIIDITT